MTRINTDYCPRQARATLTRRYAPPLSQWEKDGNQEGKRHIRLRRVAGYGVTGKAQRGREGERIEHG